MNGVDVGNIAGDLEAIGILVALLTLVVGLISAILMFTDEYSIGLALFGITMSLLVFNNLYMDNWIEDKKQASDLLVMEHYGIEADDDTVRSWTKDGTIIPDSGEERTLSGGAVQDASGEARPVAGLVLTREGSVVKAWATSIDGQRAPLKSPSDASVSEPVKEESFPWVVGEDGELVPLKPSSTGSPLMDENIDDPFLTDTNSGG